MEFYSNMVGEVTLPRMYFSHAMRKGIFGIHVNSNNPGLSCSKHCKLNEPINDNLLTVVAKVFSNTLIFLL